MEASTTRAVPFALPRTPEQTEPRSVVGALRGRLPTAAAALAVVAVSLADGGYASSFRLGLGVAVWWGLALAVVLGVLPLSRVPGAAVAGGALLAGFVGLTGLSTFWADSPELAFAEFDRGLLYLGLFALVVTASRRGSAGAWADGLAVGVAAVAALALANRLFPDLLTDVDAPSAYFGRTTFLSWPLGYWNALAALLAVGLPLLLRVAVTARTPVARGLAVAAVPVIVSALYLTSSRGGIAAALVGLTAFLALTARRGLALAALGAGAGGSVAAIAVLNARPLVLDGPFEAAGAISQGRSAAVLIMLAGALVGLLYVVLGRLLPPLPSPGRRLRRLVLAGGVVIFVGAVIAADPAHRFEEFNDPPPNAAVQAGPASGSAVAGGEQSGGSTVDTRNHLTSSESSGRWQFWTAAVEQWQSAPVIGRGAGSYESWWAQHGTISYFTRQAHSLYLETMGDLGIVGLLLIVGVLLAAVPPAARRLRAAGTGHRVTVAALAAAFVTFAFAAGIDWAWEMTVLGGLGILLLALLIGPATLAGHGSGAAVTEAAPSGSRRRRLFSRGAVALLALGAIAACWTALLAEVHVDDSQRAAAAGRLDEAAASARAAVDTEPWAGSGRLQLALVEDAAGNLPAAERAIGRAIEHDPRNWRTWLVGAQIAERRGDRALAARRLDRARELNPRSPIFAAS